MLFHLGNPLLEIQAEFLDIVESTLHQNVFIQPTPLQRRRKSLQTPRILEFSKSEKFNYKKFETSARKVKCKGNSRGKNRENILKMLSSFLEFPKNAAPLGKSRSGNSNRKYLYNRHL